MYRLEWIEQLKLRAAAPPQAAELSRVSPTVWKLGATSFLTDVSSEMVNSALPVYVVLHLQLNPLQYGAIDGVANGIAVALIAVAAGVVADRTRRHKLVAAAGYAVSALCKLLLLAVGGAWAGLAAVTAIDRTGKGARAAPRDALLSLSSPGPRLATAFAVHRSLDAGGSLLGPIAAFGLLAALPGAFDAVWVTSFVFAALGLAVLWLFVDDKTPASETPALPLSRAAVAGLVGEPRFRALAACSALLALATLSDGFLYLQLQSRSGLAPQFFPLYYVATASVYAALSFPAGRAADRWGRARVVVAGYALLGVLYLALLAPVGAGPALPAVCVLLLGAHYAATEGVLMALASGITSGEVRTVALALLATGIGFGKMASSLLFGWLWHSGGASAGLVALSGLLALAIGVAWRFLPGRGNV